MSKFNLVLKNDRQRLKEYAERLCERGVKAEQEGAAALGAELVQLKPPQSGQQLYRLLRCRVWREQVRSRMGILQESSQP